MKAVRFFFWSILLISAAFTAAPAAELPVGYDSSTRPGVGHGPTPVQVGVFLIDVVEIEDARQSFTASLFFEIDFQDSRLADPTAPGVRTFSLGEIWWPDLGLVNRRSLQILFPHVFRVDRQGNVSYRQRVYGDFSATLHLRSFPFDTQKLPIEVASNTLGPEEIALSVNKDKTGRFDSLSLAGWSVLSEGLDELPHQGKDQGLARLVFGLTASRQTAFYRWSILVPLGFIVLMAWAVFWIDPQFLPPQVGLSTAATFALIAFRFNLSTILPKVDYMTYLDEFVLACTVLVFLALGQAIATGRLAKRGQEALANRIDVWSRSFYLVAFIVLSAVTLRLNF